MRPIGTAEELERRRRRAVALMKQGDSHTAIARILGVDRGSLYRWRKMALAGSDGLKANPHPGPTPGLNASQLRELDGLLTQGAKRHGWPNELWTSKRVKVVIQRHFDVRYHEGHVRKLVKERLHWTPQKPECRARERDEAAIERWVRDDFPRLKKIGGNSRCDVGVP